MNIHFLMRTGLLYKYSKKIKTHKSKNSMFRVELNEYNREYKLLNEYNKEYKLIKARILSVV